MAKLNNLPGRTTTVLHQPTGFLQVGTILGYDRETNSARVRLRQAQHGTNDEVNAQLPVAYLGYKNGMFIGGIPEVGTPVIVGQALGNVHFILTFLAKDPSSQSTFQPPLLPDLEENELKIQANANTVISLHTENGITIGEVNNSIALDTNRKTFINNFDNIYSLSESSKSISGIIKRDIRPKSSFASSLRTNSNSYNDHLVSIGMDPIYGSEHNSTNSGPSTKNPPRVEKREIVYEYAESVKVFSDDVELKSYSQNKVIDFPNINSRREGRADVLSLSLESPNYLIETIKGTVVDIYGNILDLNRAVLPIGKTDKTSAKNIKTTADDKSDDGNVYKNILALNRRSLAYHFEINTRKDIFGPPDVTKRNNWARDRSRFFVDIDKEGQTKINIPASSEVGNIALATRYENYSTVNPNDSSKNTDDLVFNENNQDILIENFTANYDDNGNLLFDNAVINIQDDLSGDSSPINRFSSEDSPNYIKHGTVYHNIKDVCKSHQSDWVSYEYIDTTLLARGFVKPKKDIINSTIITRGKNANAGGRSASISMDGSLELNLGANTSDKHSLILDTQGAVIATLGKDYRNNISAAISCDGEILITSGSEGVKGDPRDSGPWKNTASIAGAFDLRVFNGTEYTVIRVDKTGVTIATPSRVTTYAGSIQMRAERIDIEASQLLLNNRLVLREGNSI